MRSLCNTFSSDDDDDDDDGDEGEILKQSELKGFWNYDNIESVYGGGSSSSSSSSGASLSASSCGDHPKGLAIVGVKMMIKRDDLFPSCFEITSSQAQYKFTVYLRKSPQGVGLKLKSVEGKVVIRGF